MPKSSEKKLTPQQTVNVLLDAGWPPKHLHNAFRTIFFETSFRPDAGYLVPFNMTCHKLIFRPPDLDDNADNITFAIKKIDDGDNTTDSLCTYAYETTFVDHTSITINRGDWSADPTVEAGDVVAISITASDADIVTSAKGFYITSVWETEIII